MTRALVDADLTDLLPVVHALAQYLKLRCAAADPNPSGYASHSVRKDTKETKDEKDTKTKKDPVANADELATNTALIPDAEYTVKQAVAITRRKEITLRKMLQDGRLPSRMNSERRRMILGKHLARFIARAATEEPLASPATEG